MPSERVKTLGGIVIERITSAPGACWKCGKVHIGATQITVAFMKKLRGN